MNRKQVMIRCDSYDDRRLIAGMLADAGIEVQIDKITNNFNDKYWIVICESKEKVKIV